MSIVIGIDPGCSGALVALDAILMRPAGWILAPTVKLGNSTRIDAAAVARWLAYWSPITTEVVIEQVQAMPGQGVTSMFTFGHAAGVVEGVVCGAMLPHHKVTPQAWKKGVGLIGTDKDAARSRAIQLWPWWKELGKKGAGQALADAALIAYHHARTRTP